MILDLLFESPLFWASLVAVTIGSIVLHELGHALAATWEGDATPRLLGHLTWKPWVHMGWLSILLCATVGIAWGQTPVNRRNFRHRRWGDVIVSFAGPFVNLCLAVLAAVMLGVIERSEPGAVDRARGTMTHAAILIWWLIAYRNCALFVLNMIPFPPLDGFSVLDGTFDLGELGNGIRRLGNFGLLVVIVLLNLPGSPFTTVVRGMMNGLFTLTGAPRLGTM